MSEANRWDERYEKGDTPWDTGQPSSELRRVIAEAAIRPCLAVELGCGSGANARTVKVLERDRNRWSFPS
jgi:methyl halide transferase